MSPAGATLVAALALATAATPFLSGCAAPPSASGATAAATAPDPSTTEGTPAAGPSASPTPSLEPSPSPTPVRVSPLTGLPEATPMPVLVVKLDNTPQAQPHAGLDQADLVYLEEVEYGITRIAAVFASRIPDRIGPVRSARITDLDLLAQFGSPAFAFSGAQRKLWPAIADTALIDISPNKGAQGYARDRSRRAPYNYFLDGSVGIERASDASTTRDLGLVFSETAPLGGQPVPRASMSWGGASAKFTYDPIDGTYKVNLNGERAKAEGSDRGQRASTVVIQYVKQEPSVYFDKGGGNTPHADTIGSGEAVVMRDGMAYPVTWNRPSAEAGTTFTMADGSVMPFAPGQTWIVLLNRKTPATLTTPGSDPSASATASPQPSR